MVIVKDGLPPRPLVPVKFGALRDQVKDAIRGAIFDGKYRPGEPLREIELSRALNVSQTLVREALLELEHRGLVVRVRNKETRVTSLSRKELRERIDIRILLEGVAAVKASKNLRKSNYEELKEHVKAISDTVRRNDYFKTGEADLAFHRYIWEHSRDTTLFHILQQLTTPLFAFLGIILSASSQSRKALVGNHESIVTSLKEGNPANIRRTIRRHIEMSYEEFLSSGVEGVSMITMPASPSINAEAD